MARQILTPVVVTDLSDGSGATYWKHVLPEQPINYVDNDGTARTIDFNDEYLGDLAASFEDGALDQTPFMLADVDNKHTMDPERQRGEVTDMRKAEDLPPKVAARITERFGTVAPGLWTKIKFPSAEAAKAVMENPKLGVSARIREGVQRVDGRSFKRAVIHVLGTLDPKITGLQGWLPATDLSSEYAHDDVLDLTTEAPVAKNKSGGATATLPKELEGIDIENLTEADIPNLTDEQLAAFLAYAEANGDEEDDDQDGDGNGDGDQDDADADADGDDGIGTPEAQLSNAARREIDLANTTAQAALTKARAAEQRAAEAEWTRYRDAELANGVPAHVLETARPMLSRFDDAVVDLSNDGGDAEVNISAIVRTLVEATRGMIDLAAPIGHVGSEVGADDPDASILADLAKITP